MQTPHLNRLPSWLSKRQSVGFEQLHISPATQTSSSADDSALYSPDPSILESPHTPSSHYKDISHLVSFIELTPSRPGRGVDHSCFTDSNLKNEDLKQETILPKPELIKPKWNGQISRCHFTLRKIFRIGSGSFCKVYQASCSTSDGPEVVAVKIPRTSSTTNSIMFNEASLLSRLPSHRNIIHFYGIHDEFQGLVFELYPSNLSLLVEHIVPPASLDQPHVTLATWKTLAIQLLDGLAFLHAHKIVHCDIKLDNILLTDSLVPIIGDFSSAQSIDGLSSFLSSDMMSAASAVEFTAPELLTSQPTGHPSSSTDLFSLGMVMLVLATGNQPYHMANKNFMQKFTWAQSGAALECGSAADTERVSRVIKVMRLWINARKPLSDLVRLVSAINTEQVEQAEFI